VKRRESRTGRRSRRASSEGSCVQPSMGIPLAVKGRLGRLVVGQKGTDLG